MDKIKLILPTLPAVSLFSMVIIRIVVVLPAPLCPSSPRTSPEFTANDKFLIAIFFSSLSSEHFLIKQFMLEFMFAFANSFLKFYVKDSFRKKILCGLREMLVGSFHFTLTT